MRYICHSSIQSILSQTCEAIQDINIAKAETGATGCERDIHHQGNKDNPRVEGSF